MNKLITITVLLLCFVFCGCKKEKQNNLESNTNSVINNITYPIACYGHLKTETRNNYLQNTLCFQDTAAYAVFYPYKVLKSDSIPTLYSGTVYFNNDSLDAIGGGYDKSSNFTNITNCNWTVVGSPSTPSFNHLYTAIYPTFNGNSQLPDSFSLSTPVTLNIASATNFKYTYIKIDDGDLLLFKYQYNTNNINLNLTELANLAGRDSCDLEISFNNYHEFIVGGKNYIFHQTFVNFKSRIKIVP